MKKSQQRVADEFLAALKTHYPEIEEMNRTTSPDDPEFIWIRVSAPMDDDRKEELQHRAAELEIEILLEYDYRISLIPYQTLVHHS
jgi:hypothetical protein